MRFLEKLFHGRFRLFKSIDVGDGQVIVAIHGIGADGHTWDPLASIIDQTKFRLLCFDLLGFGESPKPNNIQYTVNDHAEALVKSLGWRFRRKQIVLVGHSMGCLVASHIAAKYPKMVKHMILYEPPLFADSPEFRSHARRKKLYFALYEELIQRPKLLLNYSKLMARLAEGRAVLIEPEEWVPFERSLRNTIMKQTAYNELKLTIIPTDIIYGKFDLIVTRKEVKEMLHANPNVTFHMVGEMHDVNNRAAKYIIRLLKPLY